jgi:cytochrome P450
MQGVAAELSAAQIPTLVLACHHTTPTALSWTWYLLSQHADAERQLHAELDGVLGGRAPSPDDLPQLPYTRMVIAEAMRLYPPRPSALGITLHARGA